MAETIQKYRDRQLRSLTNKIGVYVLCDLDDVPIYVGQSVDGIRTRVRRHLTSARSDAIANRQLDIWEVAYVRGFEVDKSSITAVENYLIWLFNNRRPLMQADIVRESEDLAHLLPEPKIVQTLPDEEIVIRKDPRQRLPRQAQFFQQLVDHILNVKDNSDQRRTLQAHYDRLSRYCGEFLQPD